MNQVEILGVKTSAKMSDVNGKIFLRLTGQMALFEVTKEGFYK